jgi:hypothetical protein
VCGGGRAGLPLASVGEIGETGGQDRSLHLVSKFTAYRDAACLGGTRETLRIHRPTSFNGPREVQLVMPTREAAMTFSQAVSGPAGWSTLSTYAVCTDDHVLNEVGLRDFARHCDDVITLTTSHSPFFSNPAAVAAVVDHLIGS